LRLGNEWFVYGEVTTLLETKLIPIHPRFGTIPEGHGGNTLNKGATLSEQDTTIAYLLLRTTMGVNIFIHGVSRILAGPVAFAHALVPMFEKTFLPGWFVYGFGLMLPWAEAILGLLVLIGFKTRMAVIGGSLLVFVLTFGTTLRQDWNTAAVQLLYASIYAALLAFRHRNLYSIDVWFARRRSGTF
jgi:thiosulfate dehydrogenase (quinone) large subunit